MSIYKETVKRRTKKETRPATRWEMVYGTMIRKLLASRKIHPRSIPALAKVLAFPVWLFSYPYSAVSMFFMKIRLAKIKTKSS